MNFATQEHSVLEEQVAMRYREEGYEVILQPKAAMIPFSLGGYRPDILARKDGANMLIEVKSNSDVGSSYERLQSVVEETKRHDNWSFILVTARDVAEVGLPSDPDQSSWEEIVQRMQSAERLVSMGEPEAAYSLLWIAFEQTTRKLSIEAGLPLERLAPWITIRQLYSEGVLSMAQFDVSCSALKVRNLVVHGFPKPDLSGNFELLRGLLTELLPKSS